jgi:hypothetical protein
VATLRRQCRLFAIGSSLFAIATVPGLAGAGLANLLCFIGSWFFTTAEPAMRIGWFSAATQFAGTILFNISTGASLYAHAVAPERRLVWAPDAVGRAHFW